MLKLLISNNLPPIDSLLLHLVDKIDRSSMIL